MKFLLVTVTLLSFTLFSYSQSVYQIRADSVRIYSGCDTAELILENHTQDTLGFLYNKGKGRTEFKRLRFGNIGNGLIALGNQDTLDFGSSLNGSFIQNQNVSAQSANSWINGTYRTNGSTLITKNGADTISESLILKNNALTRGANLQLTDATDPGLAFWTTNSFGTWEEKMRLTSAGYIGIGNPDPIYKIHVIADDASLALEATPGNGASLSLFGKTSSGNLVAMEQFVDPADSSFSLLCSGGHFLKINFNGFATIGHNNGNSAPKSNVDIRGSTGFSIAKCTTNITLDSTHHTAVCDNPSNITINLPSASTCTGRVYVIKKISNNTNTVTIDPSGSELLEGATTQVLTTYKQGVTIQSDGTQWWLIAPIGFSGW